MAETKNKQALIDVEYCFDRYFKENFAPILASTAKDLREKQQVEAQKIRQEVSSTMCPMMDTTTGGFPVHTMVADNLVSSGEWNKKKTEDLMIMANEKFFGNKDFMHDYQILVLSYRSALVGAIGKERYAQISKHSESGDLATDYVYNRWQRMMLELLARQRMPQSSLQYILEKGAGGSLIGMLANLETKRFQSSGDQEVEKLAEKLYHPSAGEKISSGALSFLIDFASTAGVGTAGTIGKVALGADAIAQMGLPFLSSDDGLTYEQAVSKEVFGDTSIISRYQSASKRVNPSRSENIHAINQCLSKKMKVQTVMSPIDNEIVKKKALEIRHACEGRGNLLYYISSLYEQKGIVYQKTASIPKWMKEKDDAGLFQSASYFTSLAMEMQEKNKKAVVIGKKQMSYQQVVQRGYDYAHALSMRKAEEKPMQEDGHVSYQASPVNSSPVQAESLSPKSAVSPNSISQKPMTTSLATHQEGLSSWGGMLEGVGLGGFGDIGKNLGYVLAMLPDMLIGLFTGKNKSFRMENCLLPIAAIFGGMFIRNPLLKMLLIGLGGANLLNKAGHEALGTIPEGQRQPREYRRYEDEPLNSRITDPAMKGNTLVANIDNVPSVITIESDMVLDAYYKGVLPLNVLSNAVLHEYDAQRDLLVRNTKLQKQEEVEQERTLCIR